MGRETEFLAAKAFANAYEWKNNGGDVKDSPPVTLINFGDTGPFTDGFMHAMQVGEIGVEVFLGLDLLPSLAFMIIFNKILPPLAFSSRISPHSPHSQKIPLKKSLPKNPPLKKNPARPRSP